MRKFEIEQKLHNTLSKLFKKDKKLYDRVWRKIYEIANSYDVEHYKNLKHDLKEFKRVHIKEKVLVFKFDKINNKILFFDFDHHNKIYARRF